MSISVTFEPKAININVTDDNLIVFLEDGREIKVPLVWFPRLLHATPNQRSKYYLIGNGIGIHWPDLDEDLSVAGFLGGIK